MSLSIEIPGALGLQSQNVPKSTVVTRTHCSLSAVCCLHLHCLPSGNNKRIHICGKTSTYSSLVKQSFKITIRYNMFVLLSWLEEKLLARSWTVTPKSIHIIFFKESQLTGQNSHLEPSTKPDPPQASRWSTPERLIFKPAIWSPECRPGLWDSESLAPNSVPTDQHETPPPSPRPV